MNQCNFTGRFTRDPELNKTPNNKSVVSFSLAVQRRYKDNEGNYPTDFIDFVAWGPTAEFIERNCKKGTLVRATGSLEIRSYEVDGKTRNRAEVRVTEFDILAQPGQKDANILDDFRPINTDEGDDPF